MSLPSFASLCHLEAGEEPLLFRLHQRVLKEQQRRDEEHECKPQGCEERPDCQFTGRDGVAQTFKHMGSWQGYGDHLHTPRHTLQRIEHTTEWLNDEAHGPS